MEEPKSLTFSSPVVALISNLLASVPLIEKVESESVKLDLAVRIFCCESTAWSVVSRTTKLLPTFSTVSFVAW